MIRLFDFAKSLDKKESLDIVKFNFAKAFDTVPHSQFHCKLLHYGIDIKL